MLTSKCIVNCYIIIKLVRINVMHNLYKYSQYMSAIVRETALASSEEKNNFQGTVIRIQNSQQLCSVLLVAMLYTLSTFPSAQIFRGQDSFVHT